MTEYDFTLEDLRREVLALADERPDFVYTAQKERAGLERGGGASCSYTGALMFSTEGEACIFGQALTRLGVSKDTLMGVSTNIVSLLSGKFGLDVHNIDYDDALRRVQFSQDGGVSWGEAVKPLRDLEIKTA